MRSERKKQIMTLSILVVAVLVISVGFAAFSATLRINSSISVIPGSDTFNVIFSKDGTATDTTQTVEPNSSIYGDSATITNGTTPTISGLNAKFVNPGESVTYEFYARNIGEYVAYLNNINFLGTKSCTAGTDADETLVNSACNSISLTVEVGEESTTNYITTTETIPVNAHSLNKNTSEKVKITIKYANNGARADGPFTVEFGDITMVYSTLDDSTISGGICRLSDKDLDDEISLSDEVTCGTETFYVLKNDGSNVEMLTKYNLNVGNNTYPGATLGIQNENVKGGTEYGLNSSTYGYINYSATQGGGYGYWVSWDAENGVPGELPLEKYGKSFPTYIYDSNSYLYSHVENYETYLKTNGVKSADALLMNYEQMNICQTTTWCFETSYWTGVAADNSNVYASSLVYSTYFISQWLTESNLYYGIRPVVTVSIGEILN